MEPAAPQRPVAYGQPGSTESLALDTLDTGNTFDTCLTTIPEQLVRAVDITEALSGFGQHWASIKARPEDYQLSRTVARISAFVSHDWRSIRAEKTVALMMYSNSQIAFLASLLTAVLVPILLRTTGTGRTGHPKENFKTVCGDAFVPKNHALCGKACACVIFVIVFLWWQRMRCACMKPMTIFLDKLCIHQTNAERKRLGILGLAAFMKASDRIVVLWSSRYFTRLWCTYELASWVKLGKNFSRTVHIVPVTGAFRLFLFIVISTFVPLLQEAVNFWGGANSKGRGGGGGGGGRGNGNNRMGTFPV
eukprot:TRINITY_DN16873_c0_g2_i1.p1 TRINITY_DN16873_c0_g2~~TRINITY_DN16873_c0_g2_i1.p1  ORF type:complete len:307 (+),score=16.24 TRINITY_DN16873_c0_g2_i1:202-1122(+)